jgi:hypothetical protein
VWRLTGHDVNGERTAGYSPEFLHAVADELALVARQIDRVDARIEKAKRPSNKARIAAERAGLVAYEKQLRKLLR